MFCSAFFVRRVVTAIAVRAALGPTAALAQGLRLDDAVGAAMRANPDLVIARLRADSAHAEQRIARAAPPLSLATIPQVPYQYSVGVPLDIGLQRIYRTRAASRGMLAARADVEDTTRQVVFAVREAFYDVLLAEAQREIARERRDIFRQLLAADSARLRSGDIPARDVAKSELELARAEAGLTRADAGVHAARLDLALLMGRERPDTALAVDGQLGYRPVAVPLDSLAALAAEHRPDIRAAQARAEQSRAAVGLARAGLMPVPTVALVYQAAPFGNGTNYALGIGLSLPVLSWSGGERARARAGADAALVAQRRTQAQVANDVQTARDGYLAAQSLTERYEGGVLAKAEAALETARYAYRTGSGSLLDLLEAIRTYADIRSDYFTAAHDYWVSVFALSRAVGRDFVQ